MKTPHSHPQRFRSAHPAGHDSRRNPHFDQQGGTRTAGSIGMKASPAGPAVERDTDPPDLNPYQVIRVWKRQGALVLYEYKDGQRATKLSYAVKEPSRNHYHEGDILLVADLEKRWAERIFPELKEPGEDFSAFDLVMMLLGEYEEEKYKVGWQILLISDVGWGGGAVVVQGVIFLDNVPTALKKRAEFSVNDLNTSFIQSRVAHQLEGWIPILEYTVELTETFLGAGIEQLEKVAAKRLLKATARAAMKRGLKKAFNVAFRTAVSAVGKASAAFLKAFAKEFWKDMHAAEQQQSLKKRIGSPELPKEIDGHPIFKKAVLAGADAAALALIKECLEKPMMKMFEKSLAKMYPQVEKTIAQRVSIYFSKEIVKLCTTEFASALVDALMSAWKGSLDATGKVDPQKFEKLVEDKLLSALTKAFTKRIDHWVEAAGEQEFEGMK